MAEEQNDQITRIKRLESELEALRERVSRLENATSRVPTTPSPQVAKEPPEALPGKERVAPWSVGGVAALMSRGATVSLVLLLALVLRTLTDSGTLGMKVGTMLGIGYATFLEAAGWATYRRRHPFAPIFSISGALLLAAIVVEAHASFGAISTLPAYVFLAVAGGGMALISHQNRVAVPVSVGTMAILAASLPLAFPRPNFVSLIAFLFAVNIMALSVARLPRAGWLRIVVTLYSTVVFFLWGFALRTQPLSTASADLRMPGAKVTGELPWFFLMVSVFLFFYIALAVLAIWRSDSEVRRPFDNILPTAAAGGAYLVCLMVVSSLGAGQRVLGGAGVAVATGLLRIAALKARRAGTRTKGANTFAFPAAFLLALSFRDLSGESVVALAILSWAALSLTWLSSRWGSPGVRVTSYFLQGTVLGASTLLLMADPTGGGTLMTVLSMAVVAVLAHLQYSLVRGNPPPGDSTYFTRFDRADLSGTLPLVVSVSASFFALRALLWVFFSSSPAAFQAGVTVLINLGALLLYVLARARKNTDIKWVAVMVTLLGGGKAFLMDLFKVKGIPVVLSMLSFFLAAAVGSWALRRWTRPES